MRTTSPDGTEWHVGRVWWRGRPRWRDVDTGGMDLPDGAGLGDDLLGAIFFVLLVVVLVLTIFTGVLPVLLFAGELLLVLLLAVGGLLGRILLRRPWTVRARARDGRVVERRARGWRASGREVTRLASDVRRGRTA